jgi:hypothetical protein
MGTWRWWCETWGLPVGGGSGRWRWWPWRRRGNGVECGMDSAVAWPWFCWYLVTAGAPPPRAPSLGCHGARPVNRTSPRSRNSLVATAGVGGAGKQSRLDEEDATSRRGTIIWLGRLNRFNAYK